MSFVFEFPFESKSRQHAFRLVNMSLAITKWCIYLNFIYSTSIFIYSNVFQQKEISATCKICINDNLLHCSIYVSFFCAPRPQNLIASFFLAHVKYFLFNIMCNLKKKCRKTVRQETEICYACLQYFSIPLKNAYRPISTASFPLDRTRHSFQCSWKTNNYFVSIVRILTKWFACFFLFINLWAEYYYFYFKKSPGG